MARNGHPRVPRKIRGERKRVERLWRQRRETQIRRVRAYRPNPLAAWEQELLQAGKSGSVLQVHNDLIKDAYSPMLEAALKGPITLPIPMSQRG